MSASFPQTEDAVAELLNQLEEAQKQDFIETPVDKGPPKRRAASTPYTVLHGTLNNLTKAQADALGALANVQGFQLERPSGEVWLMAVKEHHEPRRSTSIDVGSASSANVTVDVYMVIQRLRVIDK
tara:strand:+ start:325 stop:702 length:378 start_codon:yes stop_codon:yes gene_type:complete